MFKKKTIHVPEIETSIRLDVYLATELELSRSKVSQHIRSGEVNINGERAEKTGIMLKGEEVITLEPRAPVAIEDIDISIYESIHVLAETPDYLVVSKPADLLVHPTQANEPVALSHWLVKQYPDIVGVGENDVRPGIVHRLDKNASGIMVVARTQKMFEHLKKQFQERTIDKLYTALVFGGFAEKSGCIDFNIDRGKDGKMVSRPYLDEMRVKNVGKKQDGKISKTEFWVEKEFPRYSLLNVKIHSGRTHQIRVHMFSLGHPIVGDTLYINKKLLKRRDRELTRLFLHARELAFSDLQNERQAFKDELPNSLELFLEDIS